MNTWFTADQHFKHNNILKYCNRDFENIDKHDEMLINSWNKVVGWDDTVYHLGDFTLSSWKIAKPILYQLYGSIYFLFDIFHHDRQWITKSEYTGRVKYFTPIYLLKNIYKKPIVLCHFPFASWNRQHYGSLHFHGHSHGMLPKIKNRLDVGVDNAFKLLGEYRPFSLDEAVELAGQE